MTTICIRKNRSDDRYREFIIEGHSGFAKAGKDIVCAAISILTTNTINSIDELCDDRVDVMTDEKKALMRCTFLDVPSKEATLLVDSMLIGLKQIQEQYDSRYIDIRFEEV